MSFEVPSEIVIDMGDKPDRALFYDEVLEQALPDLPEAFDAADEKWDLNPKRELTEIRNSLFATPTISSVVMSSLRCTEENVHSNDISVTVHGFSDTYPTNSAASVAEWLNQDTASLTARQKAKPNTWSPITKGAMNHDIREEMGMGMPQIDIFRPSPLAAYTHDERKRINDGDFTPVGRVIEAVVAQALKIMSEHYGRLRYSDDVVNLHLHGISLGASEVIGAAKAMQDKNNFLDVKSLTPQELIMGLSLTELIKFGGTVGDPSDKDVSGLVRIYEPEMRQQMDKYGNEVTMLSRNAVAAGKMAVRLGNGITHPEQNQESMIQLAESGVPITVALAKNSYASHKTAALTPKNEQTKIITIDTVAGQTIAHISNEHVGGMVAVSLLGIKRATS